ncbi:hypothetical protein WL28_22995 [Burkholderia ubonensis]|nr:hypothetical protein WL28_22995 [Burkholderia ubonensis]KWC66642.1 hypothetical protein WL53_00045 [Burkholderia ubonensis]
MSAAIWVDCIARLEKKSDFYVSAKFGDIERRLVEFILQLPIGATFQKQSCRFQLPHQSGLVKWCITQITGDVHVRACVDQYLDIVDGALAGDKMQNSVIHGPSLIWFSKFNPQEFRMGFVLLEHQAQPSL